MERLASELPDDTTFIGVEPSEGMRARAEKRLAGQSNVQLLDGSFESLPLSDQSVDYLYSILAFHWTTDLEGSVRELKRVLRPSGSMDLHFTGRKSGIEFIEATAPIYRKYLGFRQWLKTARLRQSLTLEQICEVLCEAFPFRLTVTESFETYYDTLEGHMGWWLRIRGHFDEIESKDREACDREVEEALSALATEQGIPYTVHMIHVHLAR
jgi:ubiquinone/menaquinone biosynthesis C-methylase UbiE